MAELVVILVVIVDEISDVGVFLSAAFTLLLICLLFLFLFVFALPLFVRICTEIAGFFLFGKV